MHFFKSQVKSLLYHKKNKYKKAKNDKKHGGNTKFV